MSRKVMSIRGEVVDFDLFDIKKQILTNSKNNNSEKRERFINKKRRKKNQDVINKLLNQTVKTPEPVEIIEDKKEDKPKPSKIIKRKDT